MDFITACTTAIIEEIGVEIIEVALKPKTIFNRGESLRSLIEVHLLNGFVDIASNVRGVTINVPISSLQLLERKEDEQIWRVPPGAVGNRKITSVQGMVSSSTHTNGSTTDRSTSGNPIQALSNINRGFTGHLISEMEMMSNDELWVRGDLTLAYGDIGFTVAYGDRMPEINERTYLSLIEIVMVYVKARLYTLLKFKIRKGEIYHGHSLSDFREEISGWRDSMKEFRLLMKVKGHKLLTMNDTKAASRSIGFAYGVL